MAARPRHENSPSKIRLDRGGLPPDFYGRLQVQLVQEPGSELYGRKLVRDADGRIHVCEYWLGQNPRQEGYIAKEFDPSQLLKEFIDLHDAEGEPDRILAFAARYGNLDFCEHWSTSSTHSLMRIRAACPECPRFPVRRPNHDRLCPLDAWVAAARHMRAILSLAADLRAGVPTPREDYEAAGWGWLSDNYLSYGDPPQWGHLYSALQFWTSLADGLGVDPIYLKDRDADIKWRLHVRLKATGDTGPRSSLVAQLLAVLNSEPGIYRCDECRAPHARRRRPPKGKPGRCPKCRNGLDRRAATERTRYAVAHQSKPARIDDE
jgi:hypothetical protein